MTALEIIGIIAFAIFVGLVLFGYWYDFHRDWLDHDE